MALSCIISEIKRYLVIHTQFITEYFIAGRQKKHVRSRYRRNYARLKTDARAINLCLACVSPALGGTAMIAAYTALLQLMVARTQWQQYRVYNWTACLMSSLLLPMSYYLRDFV